MFHYRYIWMLLSLCLFTGCSSRSLREARNVVHEADSLWQQGQMYDDSTQLAQAYNTLHAWRAFYTDEYAHACYHYGKLLRAKEDPVSAMQVFINATRSHTHDFHMLGRVYSNMGDICHLAGAFPLAYDMYRQSGEWYLRNSDTLLYYYDLNNMAFELAEQGKKDSVFTIMTKIESQCTDTYLLIKLLETKAEASLYSQQYDSAIYYTSQLLTCGYYEPAGLMIRAQAYSLMGMKDSAVYYARLILSVSSDLYNQCNALYILTQDNDTQDVSVIKEKAAERADTQKMIEIWRSKYAQAVQLLEQDLARKPEWRGYAIIVLIALGAIAIIVFAVLEKKHKRQMHKHVSDLANKQAESMIESINKYIDVSDLNRSLHWNNYSAMKINADLYMSGIVSKLEAYHFNETEVRFCVLTLLNFRQKQIAETIHYSYPSGLKTLKKRISDKLGTTPPELRNFLLRLLPQM